MTEPQPTRGVVMMLITLLEGICVQLELGADPQLVAQSARVHLEEIRKALPW